MTDERMPGGVCLLYRLFASHWDVGVYEIRRWIGIMQVTPKKNKYDNTTTVIEERKKG